MIEIGTALTDAEMNKKNKEHFDRILGKRTQETIPASDELMSIAGHEIMTIREYNEFRVLPEIFLEKEQCWPVEPDLKYWQILFLKVNNNALIIKNALFLPVPRTSGLPRTSWGCLFYPSHEHLQRDPLSIASNARRSVRCSLHHARLSILSLDHFHLSKSEQVQVPKIWRAEPPDRLS